MSGSITLWEGSTEWCSQTRTKWRTLKGRSLDPWLNCSRNAYVRYHCGICKNWRYLCNTCTWQSSPSVVSPWYNYPYQEGDSYWHSRGEYGRITPEIGLRIKKQKQTFKWWIPSRKKMMIQNRHLWYFVLNVELVVPFIWWSGRKTLAFPAWSWCSCHSRTVLGRHPRWYTACTSKIRETKMDLLGSSGTPWSGLDMVGWLLMTCVKIKKSITWLMGVPGLVHNPQSPGSITPYNQSTRL